MICLELQDNTIYLNRNFYAACPNCHKQLWLLKLDGPGDKWKTILGTECACCHLLVEWKATPE